MGDEASQSTVLALVNARLGEARQSQDPKTFDNVAEALFDFTTGHAPICEGGKPSAGGELVKGRRIHRESTTRRRPPEVSLTVFTARPPDLQPWPLMDADFAISCSLVRPGLPQSDSCTSGRGFAPCFLQTTPRDVALALR
ncbi:MAG TPA: hypothetical protein VIK18_06035 [Pirellulales bacterium]